MQYTERVKIALNYAEESSKRSRWIVFMLQLTVIIVIASLWQEAESNWIQKRLNAAQDLVRVLSCAPEQIYGKDAVQRERAGLPSTTGLSRIDLDYLDSKYYCAEILRHPERIERAIRYHGEWGYSLAEAKKNVADLQQIMVNRVLGVSIPVLGVVFDINDLSLLSGITFVILLSWFYFSLQRQRKNVTHVFDIARSADLSGEERSNCLSATYYLLAMTQVLTIPPATEKDTQKTTFLRRLSRLPSLIMWTAVVAQILVVLDDIMTMALGETLNPRVNRVETWLAGALLVYLIIRTVECFRLMEATDEVWKQAFADARIAPEARRAAAQQEAEKRKRQSHPLPESEKPQEA